MLKYLRLFVRSMLSAFMTFDQALADAVNGIANPILSGFGIELQKNATGLYTGASQHVRITVWKDRYGPFVFLFKPLGTDMPSWYKQGVDLWWILLALAPEIQFVPKAMIKTAGDVRWEVERQTKLVAKYCGPMLEGDMSDWQKVLDLLKLLSPPGSEEEKERMRALASEAYERGNYELASHAYSLLTGRVEFTVAEKRQMRLVQHNRDKRQRKFGRDEMPTVNADRSD